MSAFLRSSILKKYVMGVTGLIWMGFLFAHMAGNFLLFIGPDAYNTYSHKLVTNPIIYIAEVVLVVGLFLHILTAVLLVKENRSAKGSTYVVTSKGEKSSSLASRTMVIHGLFVLAFVILHLIGFKFGTHYETILSDGTRARDIFALVVEVFKNPGYVAWYVLCLILLGLHLSHGASAIFQSLGLLSYSSQQKIQWGGKIYAGMVTAGFLAQPLYVYFVY